MLRRIWLTSVLALLFFGCAPSTPTLIPSAEAPLAGTQATPTVRSDSPIVRTATVEIATAVPGAMEAAATFTPEPEPTMPEITEAMPTPVPKTAEAATTIPQPWANSGAIQIYSPGPQSKIISPLAFYGYAVPGYKRRGKVELLGEDGRILASETLQLNTAIKWAYFSWSLPFAIESVGELGRLSLSTQDEYGRLTAVNSIHLLLLPEGSSIIYPPGDLDLMERCVIESPVQGQKGSGGTLQVRGKMLPFNNLPLNISLIGRDGLMLNSQLVPVIPDGTRSMPFQVDMPYALEKGAWALLTVSQFDDRISGLMYLYSQEIFLNP